MHQPVGPHELSRRETQILEALYASDGLSVHGVRRRLPNSPTPMAVRALLKILGAKGMVSREKRGREFIYFPAIPRARAGIAAARRLIDVYFGGSTAAAIEACIAAGGRKSAMEGKKPVRKSKESPGDRVASGNEDTPEGNEPLPVHLL